MPALTRVVAVVLLFLLSGGAVASSAQEASSPDTARSKEVAAPSGSISGRVMLGETPAAGISIGLTSAGGPTPRQSPLIKAITDESGRYTLAGVPPGRHSVVPFTPTFVISELKDSFQPGKLVTVAPGEAIGEVDFTLTRGGVITGRVTDAEGRPIIGEQVRIAIVDGRGTNREPYFYNRFGHINYETDDRGIYRIFGLPAGRYTVSVGRSNDTGGGGYGRGREYYPRTFHPGVTVESKATIIEVSAGSEVTGVDIVLGRRMQSFVANGRVVDAESGRPAPDIVVRYSLSSPTNQGFFDNYGGRSNAKGEFRIESLPPGRYTAMAGGNNRYYGPEDNNDFYSDPVTFQVTDRDTGGLEIRVRRAGSISGTVILEGANKTILARLPQQMLGLNISAPGRGPQHSFFPGKIGADGGFQIKGLYPGKARIYLAGNTALRKGFMVLRIERDGIEQRDGIEIDQGEQITGVRVVLAYGTGIVRGQVKIEGGTLPEGAQLHISGRPVGVEESARNVFGQVDARGRFLIEGILAGTYELSVEAYVPATGRVPLPRPAKQTVTVADKAESEVTIMLDLSLPNGGNP